MHNRRKREAKSSIPDNLSKTLRLHVSRLPFNNLKLTTISEILVNEIATACYLLLRVNEMPTLNNEIRTTVEDHVGNVSVFTASNCYDPDADVNPDDVFPTGSVFILKEPLLTADSTGREVIRCDSPTDVVMLHKQHRLHKLVKDVSWSTKTCVDDSELEPRTNETWKNFGNECFKKKLFFTALNAYFDALRLTDDDEVQLRVALNLNISAAYLRLDYFESALQYAKLALDEDPRNAKASYRAGRAHYELRQYEEALLCFQDAVTLSKGRKDIVEELARCQLRLDEKTGKFDIYRLFLTSKYKPKTTIDCADYKGPWKVIYIPGKGRGVVATQDIEPGTLLSVSKALRASFNEPSTAKCAKPDKTSSKLAHHKLVTKLALILMKNPSVFGTALYDLTSNDETRARLYCDEDANEEPIADVERISKIVKTNSYSIEAQDLQERAANCEVLDDGTGLFCYPAYMNHSCVFNASWQTYNDIMVVYAVKPIKRGAEVFLSYFGNLKQFPEREEICLKRMFRCSCPLCQLDRKESKQLHEKRAKLAKKFESLLPQGTDKKCIRMAEMKKVISEIEDSYKATNREALLTSLLVPYLKLALAMFLKGELDDLLIALDKALSSIGLTLNSLVRFSKNEMPLPENSLLSPMIFQIIVMAVCGHWYLGTHRDVFTWFEVLLTFEKMYTGGNVHTVKAKYKNIPQSVFSNYT